MEKANPKNPRWTIDWSDLKQVALRVTDGNFSDFTRSINREHARDVVASSGDGWRGFSSGQLKRWLTEGYQTEAIHGLADFIPPIREKRKFIFGEEGDEFHFDIAAGGDDNYMSHFTKRDAIAGIRLEFTIGMHGHVRAETVNAYQAWLCRVAYSIEAGGVDAEITVNCPTLRLFNQDMRTVFPNVIRVKKENEVSDFLSWSAMLSPASFRGMMFLVFMLHGEARGYDVANGLGKENPRGWGVEFEPVSSTLAIYCDPDATGFPEEKMTTMLREQLRKANVSK